MATIITKNSSTASSVPLAAQLVQGELAVNVTDKRLFTENNGGTVVELGTNPSSLSTGALAYTGTLTGGTGVVNLGSGQVYKDASGNVGIGTSSPQKKFVVSDAGAVGMEWSPTDYTSNMRQLAYNRTTGAYVALRTEASQHEFYIGGTERARIDSSGNVGIGTSSPTTRLSVVSGTNAGISVSDGTVNTIIYNSTGGVSSFGTTTNHPVDFYSNNAARMRLDSSGNLLVGTASNIGAVSGRLNVKQSASANCANFQNGNDAGWGIAFYNVAGTVAGSISWTATTTTYATSSDYRLKEAIAPMTGALAKVALLKPCTYKWKVDGSDGQGFIAHELAEVEAGCVTGEKDAVDADGNPQYQGIDTSFLVATLAAAIQELKAIVDTQAARITALESI